MPELYSELVRKVAKRKEEQEAYLKEVTEIVNGKLKAGRDPGETIMEDKTLLRHLPEDAAAGDHLRTDP